MNPLLAVISRTNYKKVEFLAIYRLLARGVVSINYNRLVCGLRNLSVEMGLESVLLQLEHIAKTEVATTIPPI